jgi:ubiquinone/menaquinone biosynthesis C-methylase UbiE
LVDASVPVSLMRASAEQLPFSEAVFDTLVITWTLCSIPNPNAALHEMRRVLKVGGRLLFVEHGLSPEARIIGCVQKVLQNRVNRERSWYAGDG